MHQVETLLLELTWERKGNMHLKAQSIMTDVRTEMHCLH